MASLQLNSDFMPLRGDDLLRRHLEALPDMKSISTHGWKWTVDNHPVNVCTEADGSIRIALELPESVPAGAAMELNHQLPGNLRFATRGRTHVLLADTLVDGHAHLPQSFAVLKAGVEFALGGSPVLNAGQPLALEKVNAAIDEAQWPDGGVIEKAMGWELRPRVRGRATAVQATIGQGDLRISRALGAKWGPEATRHSICAQALRFNAQLRHARLAAHKDELFVETRLHAEQITATWVETAAWAVAVAFRHTEDILCVLAENPGVASAYAEMFLNGKKKSRLTSLVEP